MTSFLHIWQKQKWQTRAKLLKFEMKHMENYARYDITVKEVTKQFDEFFKTIKKSWGEGCVAAKKVVAAIGYGVHSQYSSLIDNITITQTHCKKTFYTSSFRSHEGLALTWILNTKLINFM